MQSINFIQFIQSIKSIQFIQYIHSIQYIQPNPSDYLKMSIQSS